MDPLRRVPPEVAFHIFAGTLPEQRYPWPTRRRIPTPTKAPLLLCHVSASWRRFVMSSPALWQELTITHHMPHSRGAPGPVSQPPSPALAQQHTDQIRLWARNARDTPISLTLHIHSNQYPDSDLRSMLNAVFGPAPDSPRLRIRRLCMRTGIGDITTIDLKYLQAPARPLDDLEELVWRSLDTERSSADSLEWVNLVPRLRRVQLSFACGAYPALPYAQLSHLSLTDHHPASLLHDMLRNCTNLISLTMFICDEISHPSGPAHPIHARRLEELRLNIASPANLSFFRNLFFPNLSSLLLTGCSWSPGTGTTTPFAWEGVTAADTSHMHQQLSGLASLTLGSVRCHNSSFVSTLRQSSSLRELVIGVRMESYHQLLVDLDLRQPPLVPKLERIELHAEINQMTEAGYDLEKARMQAALDSLVLSRHDATDREILQDAKLVIMQHNEGGTLSQQSDVPNAIESANDGTGESWAVAVAESPPTLLERSTTRSQVIEMRRRRSKLVTEPLGGIFEFL